MACKNLLLAVLLVSISSALSNNLTIGSREYGDFMLQRNFIQVPYKTLQIVELTETFSSNNFYRITQAKFVDLNNKGKGANVSVLKGGLNSNYVTAKFVSQRGEDIEFQVEIYGK